MLLKGLFHLVPSKFCLFYHHTLFCIYVLNASSVLTKLFVIGVDINLRDKKGQTVMDLLSANPSQRSREITAKIYSMLLFKSFFVI